MVPSISSGAVGACPSATPTLGTEAILADTELELMDVRVVGKVQLVVGEVELIGDLGLVVGGAAGRGHRRRHRRAMGAVALVEEWLAVQGGPVACDAGV